MRQRNSCLVIATIVTAVSCLTHSAEVRAQTPGPQAVAPAAGTAGRIAKFTDATTLGNSVITENAGNIGIGTAGPRSRLDIRARNALNMEGPRPLLTFRDSSAGNARHIIQSVDGGLSLLTDDYITGANPLAFVRVDGNGRIGIGTANPTRALQIGPSFDAMFTIEPSDASPRAGFIRFGDKTGWQLRIGRSRESSGGPLNTGLTGALFTFRDDGAFGPTGYPLLATGVEPLCRTLANFITRCQTSSLRYKADIADYKGGLDVVGRLRPISFTRKHSGANDIGLGAEDVEAIEPRLTFRNEQGEVEGIRYELLGAVFINAIKQQQQQIDEQRKLIEELQATVARLAQANQQGTAR